ncbi:DUF6804 family protein [Tabrizicola sp. BL-A-41-H6]|uniref:DUF6804 family protein n=1 Tax=Tabrizicola sp. BL-A-41-H6 TaxID=3421107 RepID=UPI003D6662F8
MKQLHPAIWLLPAAMLLIALLPLPYGYYQLLRVIVFGCAAVLAWKTYEATKTASLTVVVFGSIALLMNPFIPVELPRVIWMGCDVLFAAIILNHFLRSKKSAA